MKQEAEFADECEVDDVPVSAFLSVKRRNPYGSVPGLDDDETADPRELERQVMQQEWGPVLRLPVRGRRGGFAAAMDENGGLDWGAFGTVDFERTMPEFDKARYKADKLQEKLRDVLILVSIVSERLPKARCQVLKYLERGVIELGHIVNEDMRALAGLYRRARCLQAEIKQLREAGRARRGARLAAVLR